MITDNIYGGGSLGPDRRVALVTGATRGLRKAMAEELLGSGFAVACALPLPSVRNFSRQNFLSVWTLNVLAPLDLVSRALPYLDAVGG